MPDAIQDDLSAWVYGGDRAAGERAVEALADEWRPRVRHFLRSPSPQEVEDQLAEALVTLCLAADGSAPRALAPEGAADPAAWRRRVLKHHLIDVSRKERRRRHAREGVARGWSPRVEAERWRREKEAAGGGIPAREAVEVSPPPAAVTDPREAIAGLDRRERVLALLPTLSVRRRVLILLAMDGDPTPFLEELAEVLGERPEETAARLDRALHTPHDGTHDYLSEAEVRAVYPRGALRSARESARKALARAIEELRGKLGEGA